MKDYRTGNRKGNQHGRRTASSPRAKHYTTDRLREEFLIQNLFVPGEIKMVYSHIDRIITGAAVPAGETLVLTAGAELRAEYFLQRREMGIINIGGAGVIVADGKEYEVGHKEGMYIGMGVKEITLPAKKAQYRRNSILTAHRRTIHILRC